MEHYYGRFEPDREAGGYVVTFPDFGYGATQGDNETEAMEMAQDLLMLTIEDYLREGKPLPTPARRRGNKFRPVPLTALQSAKVDLYNTLQHSGMTQAEFARQFGRARAQCAQLFSLRHRSPLDQIEKALAKLGKRLHVEARDAA